MKKNCCKIIWESYNYELLQFLHSGNSCFEWRWNSPQPIKCFVMHDRRSPSKSKEGGGIIVWIVYLYKALPMHSTEALEGSNALQTLSEGLRIFKVKSFWAKQWCWKLSLKIQKVQKNCLMESNYHINIINISPNSTSLHFQYIKFMLHIEVKRGIW